MTDLQAACVAAYDAHRRQWEATYAAAEAHHGADAMPDAFYLSKKPAELADAYAALQVTYDAWMAAQCACRAVAA